MTAPWVRQVLDFWFLELAEDQWWTRDPVLDATIRARFGDLHAKLVSDADGVHDAPTALATVIVLDQFSRNLYRDDPRAYAADALARHIAEVAFARGWDTGLASAQRMFLALPFEHSEDRADQARAVALMAAIGQAEWTASSLAHQSLIERFGRFPHRNAILGRVSTEAELAALAEPMSSF